VGDLVELVTGKKGQDATPHPHNAMKAVSPKRRNLKMPSRQEKEVRPDQVIPFNENDSFDNF